MLLVVLFVIGRRFETMIRWPPSIASSGERWKDENTGLNRTGIGINRIAHTTSISFYLYIYIDNIQAGYRDGTEHYIFIHQRSASPPWRYNPSPYIRHVIGT
jgi:hypothetical protein